MLLPSSNNDGIQDLVQILCYQRKLSVLQIFCNKISKYLLARLGRALEIRVGVAGPLMQGDVFLFFFIGMR